MSGSVNAPTVTTTQGALPRAPSDLNAQLITIATALAPGLTANLPASLVEDMASTATGALVVIDQAQVDTINSLTPFGANPSTALALGQIYLGQGSTSNPASNTSVFVTFTGTVGFIIPPGFIVSDGSNQYTIEDGGVIQTGGTSGQLFAQALQPGSFAVPANTVTTLITSVPGGITLAVNNPQAGTPGGAFETTAQYAARVLQAGLVASTGMPNFLKTELEEVNGVVSQLVSVRQQTGGGWEVIVGGNGDAYAIAAAIFFSLFDVSSLTGSQIQVTAITNAANGQVTTNLNHGYATGQVIQINGAVGITGINGVNFTITVVDQKNFLLNHSTSGSGTWTSGGVVTPNFRNVSVNLNNYPDTYTIPFVVPPLQTVLIQITWNTTSSNFVSPIGVAALAQPAVAAYINAIPVGAPINIFELNEVFTSSISTLVDPDLVTRIVVTVTINGVVTAPGSGTGAVSGDPESYFSISASNVTVVQG